MSTACASSLALSLLNSRVCSLPHKRATLSLISSTSLTKQSANVHTLVPFTSRAETLFSSPFSRNVAAAAEYGQEEDFAEDETSFSPELKLFVGNLPFSVDSAQLAGLFESAGNVEMVEVIYDKVSGRSRGFGFVTMSSIEEAETAVQQFNGYELEGRALRVSSGPPPQRDGPRPPRTGGFGGSSESGNRVYVGNLSWGVDNVALENLFSEQGKVKEAKVVYDRESGRSKGFGFVTYSSSEEVDNAIESLNGVELDGRPIRVSVAESRPPRRQF